MPTFVLLFASAIICSGANDAPEMRNVTLGLNAQVRNRFWTPLLVDIVNPGPERMLTISAESTGERSGQRMSYRRTVWMPANAQRQVDFPVLPDMRLAVDTTKVDIQTAFNVKLTDGGAHVWAEMSALGQIVPEESLSVLVADSRFVSYVYLKGKVVGPEKRVISRTVLRPRDLPKRPLYFHGYDAAILGDLGEEGLTPLQQRALRDWVRSGGHLIVTPGARLPDGELGDLLPVRYFTTNLVETVPGIAGDHRFTAGLPFVRMLLRDGEVVLGDRNSPLAVTRDEGLGQVTALAIDCGGDEIQHWAGAAELMTKILVQPRMFHYADRILERSQSVEGMLSSLAGIKVPSRRTLLSYLAVVVGGLLLVLMIFRFTKHPEWGWVMAAVLAIGGSIAAVAAATTWKAQPSPFLAELFVVTGRSGERSANLQSAMGLFSPSEYNYHVETTDDTQSVRPGPSHLTPPEEFIEVYEANSSLPQFRVRADDIRLLYGRGSVNTTSDMTGQSNVTASLPTVTAKFTADGLELVAENATGFDLEDAFFKFNRFVIPLDDLRAGGRLERDGIREPTGVYSTRLVNSLEDELRSRLRVVFFPEPVFSLGQTFAFEERRYFTQLRGKEMRPVLYGWGNRPPSDIISVHPAVASRASGLWAIEARQEFATGALLVPRGIMTLRLKSKSAATNAAGEGRFFGSRATELVLQFQLPDGWPDLDVQEATVFLEFRGSAFNATVAVAPSELANENDMDTKRFTALDGGGRLRIRDPKKYYDPATRTITVAVLIDLAQKGAQAMDAAILGLSNWQVREIDVELKGTTR